MVNYGFKTSNESPLQHEMRKENAAKWKPSLSSQRGREGFRAEVTKPKANSQSPRPGVVPEGESPGKWVGARLTEDYPLPMASTGHHSGRAGSAHQQKSGPSLGCRQFTAEERCMASSGVGLAMALLFCCCAGRGPML